MNGKPIHRNEDGSIDDYNSGMSLEELGRKHNMSAMTIRSKLLRCAGKPNAKSLHIISTQKPSIRAEHSMSIMESHYVKNVITER